MNFKSIKDKVKTTFTKQNIKGFFQKQGLYVLIFICLAAAGITAIVAWPRVDTDEPAEENGADVSIIDAPSLDEELAMQSAIPIPTPDARPSASAAPAPSATSAPVIAQSGSGSVKLTRPLEGEIVAAFSGDALVLYPSLNVWATHNGIDIKAERGAEVKAALSGVVESAYTNEADGGVVVLSHSGKAETVYAGLEDIDVKQGDKVSVGKVIAKVGEMPKELDRGYHLHFEYKVNGSYKDPAKCF